MIGDEAHRPYMRPPLSKELWFSGEEAVENLNFKDWAGKERTYVKLKTQSISLSLADSQIRTKRLEGAAILTFVLTCAFDKSNKTN